MGRKPMTEEEKAAFQAKMAAARAAKKEDAAKAEEPIESLKNIFE